MRFSRRTDFVEQHTQKTISLTENQFSGKTYFYAIHPGEGLYGAEEVVAAVVVGREVAVLGLHDEVAAVLIYCN